MLYKGVSAIKLLINRHETNAILTLVFCYLIHNKQNKTTVPVARYLEIHCSMYSELPSGLMVT